MHIYIQYNAIVKDNTELIGICAVEHIFSHSLRYNKDYNSPC